MKTLSAWLLGVVFLAAYPFPAADFLDTRESAASAPAASAPAAVVLSDPADPYYPLALEIAEAEGLALAHTWAEALGEAPLALIWVAAPGSLSDQAMIAAAAALRASPEPPGVGLITGASLEEARGLLQRGGQAKGESCFTANGEYPTAGILQPRLVACGAAAGEAVELTRASFSAALAGADYATFSGHGGGRYLKLSEAERYQAKDLPGLPPLVLSAGSCQTFRPWVDESILLGFVEKGAAAYIGFVFSPLEGYLIGGLSGLPLRYTWPGFPVARAVALQNRGAMQGYAALPHYFLAGDPRISLAAAPPYRLVSDTSHGPDRVLEFSDAPAGVLPVRIEGGAVYAYVSIEGVGAAAEGDFFFNSRIQMMDARGDKYLLFQHPGGPFTFHLRQNPPWYWRVTRPLLDSLDHVVLFTPQNGGGAILIGAGAAWLVVGLLARRKEMRRQGFRAFLFPFLVTWAAAALLYWGYAWMRIDAAAVNAKPLEIDALWLVGAGLCAGSGALLYRSARGWPGKGVALLAACSPALLPALVVLGIVGAANLLYVTAGPGSAVYNAHLALVCLPAALVMGVVSGVGFEGASRWRSNRLRAAVHG